LSENALDPVFDKLFLIEEDGDDRDVRTAGHLFYLQIPSCDKQLKDCDPLPASLAQVSRLWDSEEKISTKHPPTLKAVVPQSLL